MKCIILAAGRGTRMGDLCDDCPKPMLPIKGRPKLAYTLDTLPEVIDEVVFVVGYLQEQIRDYFGVEHMGRRITYVEQVELSGTAAALALAAPHVDGEKFLVLNGDDLYMREDLEEMLTFEYSILVCETPDVTQYAYVDLYDDGSLRDVVEFPHDHTGPGLFNTGAYVMHSDFFDVPLVIKSPGSDEHGLPQTLVSGYPEIVTHAVVTKKWFPIGNPENLKVAQEIIHEFL